MKYLNVGPKSGTDNPDSVLKQLHKRTNLFDLFVYCHCCGMAF